MSVLTVVEFGDELLRTQDLDPVYAAIVASNLDYTTEARLCLAYWCFYHLGAAARLAEIKNPKHYWETMQAAAANVSKLDGTKPWPRGSERRHFRGTQAVDAMNELVKKYKTPEAALESMIGGATFGGISYQVQQHRGFGPWIAFKIADMAERVIGVPVDFSDCHLGIYKDPRQGAAVAWMKRFWSAEDHKALGGDWPGPFVSRPWDYPISDEQLRETVDYYVALWRKKRAKAPPKHDRLVNIQEIETIFCKYKSHLKGHYPMGKDTIEVRHGLRGWGDLAQHLSAGLPGGAS